MGSSVNTAQSPTYETWVEPVKKAAYARITLRPHSRELGRDRSLPLKPTRFGALITLQWHRDHTVTKTREPVLSSRIDALSGFLVEIRSSWLQFRPQCNSDANFVRSSAPHCYQLNFVEFRNPPQRWFLRSKTGLICNVITFAVSYLKFWLP